MRTRDLAVAAAVAAVAAAKGRDRQVRIWGTVTSVSSDVASVTMDDGGSVYAQVVTKLPSADDRVLVEFGAGGSALVVGRQGGFA